jgi:hypothetical protein
MAAEKQFETKVKKWLESVGVYAAGTPSQQMKVPQVGWYLKVWGGGYQKSGIPDLILCVNGFFISVELKAPTGHASELQKMNTARINQSNGIGIILFPDGFEKFKIIMKGVMECNVHIQELKLLKNAHSSTKCDIVTKY